ncbi:MAG: 5-carboxymethyl-2-hydroxymuconate isomerase [Pseudomonadota bacterium]
MPHLNIEYSQNLDGTVDISTLCDVVRKAAIDTGVFPMPGIRVRAFAATHVSIADGDPRHGFIDISVRLRAGRSDADKARATQAIFSATERFLVPVMEDHPIALSLEMRDIDPTLSPKTSTIRNFLKA